MTTRRPVTERLLGRREVLARTALARIVEEIPVYRRLPAEQLEGEILGVVRAAMHLTLDSIATGEQPSEETLAALRSSAVRRAEERVPLDGILGAYHCGADVVWDAIVQEAQEDETQQVIQAGGRMLAFVQLLTVEVAAAYLDEHRAIHSEEREADRARLERLLGPQAQRPEDWPSESGITLIDARFGRSPDEDDPGVEGAVAARRKVRRAEQWLRTISPIPAAVVTEERATIALAHDDPSLVSEQVQVGLRDSTGVEVLLAAVRVEDDGPARAEAGAALLNDLAIERGWADRAVTVDDLLVPYLVARVPEVRRRATEARERLEDGPDLLDTLASWFDHDFDRRATAAALHVHPNTLDHRLRRISERLGADLSTASGIELGAMVTAVARS